MAISKYIKDNFQTILRKYFGAQIDWIVAQIAKVSWKQTSELTAEDKAIIMEMLKKDYYIIATRRRNHLSTWAIAISDYFLTRKVGFYSHVLMNLEDEVKSVDDFRLVEATGAGSHYTAFDDVFAGVDAVCLLSPKDMTIEEWTVAMDKVKTLVGRPYDRLYDLADENALSCVELVRAALKANPDYLKEFFNFEVEIVNRKNLTPQMFVDCKDFTKAFEVKR